MNEVDTNKSLGFLFQENYHLGQHSTDYEEENTSTLIQSRQGPDLAGMLLPVVQAKLNIFATQ